MTLSLFFCLFFFVCSFLLTQSKNSLGLPTSFVSSVVSEGSPKVSFSKCTFGGGINNSTVIELANCEGYIFLIGMTLGTGTPQTFYFQFDTGSPTLWVAFGQSYGYKSNLSKTFSYTNETKTLPYGDGSYTQGYIGNDILTVSGTPINVNNSILWATLLSDGALSAGPADMQGLVGMDYGSTNFLDLAYQKGQISTPVFALQLAGPNKTAFMHYNNGLSQSIVQRMTWVPLQNTSQQFWQTNLLTVQANGIDFVEYSPNKLVVDSGSSVVQFDTKLWNAIVQKFFSSPECTTASNGLRACYCNGTWPDILIYFSSFLSVNLSAALYKLPSEQNRTGFCQIGIRGMDIGEIILGAVFMRGHIVQFDRLRKALGFYDKLNPPTLYYLFYPNWFAVSQYVFCGLGALLAVVGVGLLIHSRRTAK